jgi:septal ring factor EnvC (AmiA/AmiB activator)
MNIEKTMDFILAQQAQFEVNFAKSEKRLDRIEKLLAQNNHLVGKLAGYGVSLRSDIRRHDKQIAAAHVRAEQAYERAEEARKQAEEARKQAEAMKADTDAAIKSLARTVEQYIRRNGK